MASIRVQVQGQPAQHLQRLLDLLDELYGVTDGVSVTHARPSLVFSIEDDLTITLTEPTYKRFATVDEFMEAVDKRRPTAGQDVQRTALEVALERRARWLEQALLPLLNAAEAVARRGEPGAALGEHVDHARRLLKRIEESGRPATTV